MTSGGHWPNVHLPSAVPKACPEQPPEENCFCLLCAFSLVGDSNPHCWQGGLGNAASRPQKGKLSKTGAAGRVNTSQRSRTLHVGQSVHSR